MCIKEHHTYERIENVDIIISNNSDIPLYEQIKNQIKEAVFKGDVKDGDSMPSIRNFASDLKVSVLTIRRVYDELEQEGFIYRQVGIGTFISIKNEEKLRDCKRRTVEKMMEDMIKEAKLLGITKDELNKMMDILYEDE